MKIAFVHYHLKTGGVTTVLKRQIAALRGRCDTLVLTGDRADGDVPCAVAEIPELGYTRSDISPPDANRVAERILAVLTDAWPGGCDILHVHNPTLAKNRKFLQIIKRLQQSGVNLFLQIHDFAEDGRPDVYFGEPYPADCHYGVINSRDRDILRKSGLKARGVHYLPNAVDSLGVRSSVRTPTCVLYPVRAIRRKNLGEALLLSLFLDPALRLAVTQPPNSPADIASYRDWVRWANEHRLPVDFEAGRRDAFSSLVGAAASMVTTSITEGFGLSFLEPWTAGKLLWGRRLADVCPDYEGNGIRLNALYERIDVPLAWFDTELFRRHWRAAVSRAAVGFGHVIDPTGADQALIRLTGGETMDFGLLSERFQRQVLNRLVHNPSAKAALIRLNPWLAHPGRVVDPSTLIENNRRAVLDHYGMDGYGERLLRIYHEVSSLVVHHCIDKTALRDAFIDLSYFPLLKWGAYGG
jgi:hypothetical protein